MPSLDLLCLANSYKHESGRCIAGVRLDGKGWVSAWELLERPAAPASARTLAAAIDPGRLLFGAKVARSALEATPAAQSIALVKPHSPSWVRRNYSGTRKVRVRFRLGPCMYELPLTDPVYAERLRALPEGEHRGPSIGIPADANLLLTVSLATPYQGFCYKLVANVVIVPAAWQPARSLTASAR